MMTLIVSIALIVLCVFTTFLVIKHRVKCIEFEEEIRRLRADLHANYNWHPRKNGTFASVMEAIKPIVREHLSFTVNVEFETRMSYKVAEDTVKVVIETPPNLTGGLN